MRRNFLRKVGGAYAFGDAIEFNGVDQYVGLASNFAGLTSTISFWFNSGNVSIINTFLGGDATIEYFRLSSSTQISVRADGSGGNANFTIPAVSNNTWYHVFFTTNGAAGRLFINAVESSSGTVSNGNRAQDWRFIGQAGFGAFYDGIIDDVLITNTLTANPLVDAIAIYNGGAGADPLITIPTARQLYRFNNNTNNDGTLGGSATLFNSPTYVPHT
jgi:hypothetical protein